MTAILQQYNDFIVGGDPYVREYFLLRSIKPMVTIISFYVLFVTYIGPSIMRHRKPIQLRRLIIVYNFVLVGYYAYFLLGGAYFLYRLGLSTFCDSTLDSRKNPLVANFYFHGYVMYVIRFIELVDTVFLVLSKKFRMITPLHVFHHSIVPIFGWFGFRSERSAYLSAFMAVNSFIHIIMYTYYAVAALGPEYQKYLWWKRYLTFMQITQFFVAAIYTMFMYSIGCTTSKFVFICSCFLLVLFFFWFIKFYRRTFVDPMQKKVHEHGYNGDAKKLR